MKNALAAARRVLPIVLVTTTLAAQFKDPAPPTVRKLAPIASLEPKSFPELEYHAAPKPLDKAATTSDWPGFLGRDRTGRSPETRLLHEWPAGGPKLVWSMERGQGFASPVIQGRYLVYTHRVGGKAHIDCLEPATGKRYWRVSYPCDYRGIYIADSGPRATPIISEGRVYVHGVEGVLQCIDLATGQVVWKRNTSEEFEVGDDFFGVVSSPLIVGNLLIQNIGAPRGPCVAAFDKRTGKLVWGAGDKWGPSCASPVFGKVHGKDRVLVLAGGESRPPTGGLVVVDPATAKIDFEFPFRSRTYASVNGSTPVLGDNWVYLTASYGVGSAALALDENGGYRRLWSSRRLALQFANAVHVGKHLYAIDGVSERAGAMVCFEPRTGKELSRTDLDWDETLEVYGDEKRLSFSVGEGSLLRADGQFLCLGDRGHLLWLDASPGGTEVVARTWLFRANESWTPPVVSRGLLYVCQNRRESPQLGGSKPARLLCYDLRR